MDGGLDDSPKPPSEPPSKRPESPSQSPFKPPRSTPENARFGRLFNTTRLVVLTRAPAREGGEIGGRGTRCARRPRSCSPPPAPPEATRATAPAGVDGAREDAAMAKPADLSDRRTGRRPHRPLGAVPGARGEETARRGRGKDRRAQIRNRSGFAEPLGARPRPSVSRTVSFGVTPTRI